MTIELDTLIIGAGQAGLALGHHLAKAGLRFAIVDAHPRVGESWRRRWDSLTLFTPRRYSGLPGLPFPGDPDGHPGKDEVAAYLETYAAHFDLPVHLNSRVESLRPCPSGGFTIETPAASYLADRVVIASGAFHTPHIPGFASGLAPDVVQLHSSGYRNPSQIPAGHVVVVGGGNTGVQIAAELADSGRLVTLAAPTLGPALPQRWLGRDVFWWFSKLGTMRASGDSRVGRRLKARNTIIGTDLKELLRRVPRLGRIAGADGSDLVLDDGTRHRTSAVVWATGFRPHYPWLEVPVLDEAGTPVHEGGVTAWPGLYFLGLPWQRTRGSAVLGWVGWDAEAIAARLTGAAMPVRVV